MPLLPLRWATVGWLSSSTKGHSSCQADLSPQDSVSGFRSPVCPFPSGLGEVTALSYYQPRGTTLSLWFPHILGKGSFIEWSSIPLICVPSVSCQPLTDTSRFSAWRLPHSVHMFSGPVGKKAWKFGHDEVVLPTLAYPVCCSVWTSQKSHFSSQF